MRARPGRRRGGPALPAVWAQRARGHQGAIGAVDPRSPVPKPHRRAAAGRPAAWPSCSGENIEAVAILIVIVLNAVIGFLTEWKAEQALAALRKQTVPVAHVLRDGAERQIPAAELVPGDVVILAAGARVPADGRVVEASGCRWRRPR